MSPKWRIRKEVKLAVALSLLSVLIAFTERKQMRLAVQSVSIQLVNVHENHFVDEKDVESLMDLNEANLKGSNLDRLNLREVENRIKTNPFVLDADLFADLKGNLVAEVELRRPMARIVNATAPDAFIAEDGTLLPVNGRYASRVVLVSGAMTQRMLESGNLSRSAEFAPYLDLIRFVRDDEFWSAQIAQIDIGSKGRITLYPQVGSQRIEFGLPEEIETRFRKLMIFYKEILPQRGWNRYERVNLEFANQIVAE
jgi:cell division protein FtsQ